MSDALLRSLFVAAVLTAGCARKDPAPATPPAALDQPASGASTDAEADGATASPPSAEAAPPPSTAAQASDAPLADPASLYETCRGRVEGPEQDGECDDDDDCATAGCSGEVCATTEAVAGLMTTCEVRPCFAALDSCGCVEGRCSWSLKDGPVSPLPGGGQPISLPQ